MAYLNNSPLSLSLDEYEQINRIERDNMCYSRVRSVTPGEITLELSNGNYYRMPRLHRGLSVYGGHLDELIPMSYMDQTVQGSHLGSYRGMPVYAAPKPKCKSCDGDQEEALHGLDMFGRCYKTNQVFWEKVRKLYWHRYLKDKAALS